MKTQEEAVKHNVSRMSDQRLLRELYWLQDQEDQPPLRQLMIREIQAERTRRESNTESELK